MILVVKEPPYSVKESGYAGFNLPIDIYLRNNNEPKKIRFNYDLHLQPVGPTIVKTQKEKYTFNSLTDDFKIKLLKGGGMVLRKEIHLFHYLSVCFLLRSGVLPVFKM
jgi:YEATS domain-containing protein 1/3